MLCGRPGSREGADGDVLRIEPRQGRMNLLNFQAGPAYVYTRTFVVYTPPPTTRSAGNVRIRDVSPRVFRPITICYFESIFKLCPLVYLRRF